ncbi:MAG: AbrB/MazE/SpoVT family DNA-binding domain-containing protein [archaeon GB-1867-035]|nr:AbrB/MazE/SpoVT family DNA-binding domain-containing protein [Candidatus Culexmicrobium profundum]
MSNQKIISKIGKRGAIYLPKKILQKLGINEGDKILIEVKKGELTIKFIPDPLSLALRIKKWAKTTVKEFEEESEREQNEFYKT